MLKAMLLLPSLYNVHLLRILSTVAAIIVFFKHEVVTSVKPWLPNWLKDLISVYLEGHVSIARLSGVKFELALEVVANSSPAV